MIDLMALAANADPLAPSRPIDGLLAVRQIQTVAYVAADGSPATRVVDLIAFDRGIGPAQLLRGMRSLREGLTAGIPPPVIGAWQDDAYYDLHVDRRELRVVQGVLRIALASFRSLVLADEHGGILFQRGPDPRPWDTSDDPGENPITRAIREGRIPGVDPLREFEEMLAADAVVKVAKRVAKKVTKKRKNTKREDSEESGEEVVQRGRYKVTGETYERFIKSATRAYPLFLSRVLW